MAMVSTLQPPSASRSSEKKNRRGLYNAEYHAECCTKYLRSAINGSDGRHTILYDLPSCGTGFSHASETATEISLYCYIVHQPVSHSATPYKYDQYMLNHIFIWRRYLQFRRGAAPHQSISSNNSQITALV